MNIAQPDITLFLDLDGVIRDVTLSNALAEEGVDAWIGRPWVETVADVGGDKVTRMIEHARSSGVSAFRQVNQRFPSGLELPMEYTTVRLGGQAGLVAIGKNLQAVAELQSRLIAAQQAMERDYWKLREVETRYRLLFDASNEPVLVLRATNLRIVEANPAAIRALGLAPAGREFLPELPLQEQEPFQAMLLRAREHGKAPGVLVHLGPERAPWLVRASLMTSEPGPVFLLQLTSVGAPPPGIGHNDPVSVEELIDRAPDGFVAVDREGIILHTNRAFLDMVQVGAKASVVGERLRRWLGRPGADLTVLLANVQRYGVVRMFSTTLHGELGTDTEVEISAVGDAESEPRHVGVLLRDVGLRLPAPHDGGRLALPGALTEQIGRTPLRQLVKDTGGAVERHYIEAALELTGGNRTAAAELLGLSRQSLYAKLNRYGLDGASHAAVERSAGAE
jgi:transcriptional regulator PpsR